MAASISIPLTFRVVAPLLIPDAEILTKVGDAVFFTS